MIPTTTVAAAAAVAATPFLSGDLFLYARNRVAFESFPTTSLAVDGTAGRRDTDCHGAASPMIPTTATTHKCILLGGLSDGLWPVPYTMELLDGLPSSYSNSESDASRWSLIQPILSSSYTGFGHSGGLHRDVEELDELVQCLLTERRSGTLTTTKVAMVGHSTGCQIIVHYLLHGRYADRVVVAALQAPVSDRESATICHDMNETAQADGKQHEHLATHHAFLQRAHEITASSSHGGGGGMEEMMPRAAFWAPITAQRFLDLFEVGGTDDYFSSDYTDAQLHERLHHVGRQTTTTTTTTTARQVLVAYSGCDEFVPPLVNKPKLLSRMCDAMNGRLDPSTLSNSKNNAGETDAVTNALDDVAIPLFLPTANHNLSSNNGADATVFVQAVCNLLRNTP